MRSKKEYSCKSYLNGNEYGKMVKYFPKVYWSYALYGTFLSLIFTIIVAFLSNNLVITIVYGLIIEIAILISSRLGLQNLAKKNFDKFYSKKRYDKEYKVEFYNDGLKKIGDITSCDFKYEDISRCIETDTNFYFEFGKLKKILIIQKNECEIELITFIREKVNNIENHLGDSKVIKNNKIHNPKFTKKLLLFLFILTLLSVPLAALTYSLILSSLDVSKIDLSKTMLICWLWLIIPLLSIVFGFKYKNAGFKCTKNIIAGIAVGFLLFILGLESFLPIPLTTSYDQIYDYEDILGIDLPEVGDLQIMNDYPYDKEDKKNFNVVIVYYDRVNTTKLVDSIKKNNNWIMSNQVDDKLKKFLINYDSEEIDQYFSIYNKTLNEYNTDISNGDENEMYVMMYDMSSKQLIIYKYTYNNEL